MNKFKYLALAAVCFFATMLPAKADLEVDDPIAVRYVGNNIATLSGNGDVKYFVQGAETILANVPRATSIANLGEYVGVSVGSTLRFEKINASSETREPINVQINGENFNLDRIVELTDLETNEIWGLSQSENFLVRINLDTRESEKVELNFAEDEIPTAIAADVNNIYIATDNNGTTKVYRYIYYVGMKLTIYSGSTYAGISDITLDESSSVYLSFYGEGDAGGVILKLDATNNFAPEPISQNQSMPSSIDYFADGHTLAVANYPLDRISFLLVGAAAKTSLIYPGDKSELEEYSVVFKWQPIDGVVGYDLWIADDAEFSENLRPLTSDVATSRLTVLELSKKYFWKVRGYNAQDVKGEWSDVFEFTTGDMTYLPPTLISPKNNAVEVAANPTFIWSKSSAGSYELQISTGPGFEDIVYNVRDLTDTVLTITANLIPNSEYYWRVRTYSSIENTSEWSAPWSFSTFNTAPAVPQLYHPLNYVVNVPVSPLLEWHPVSKADLYIIEFSRDKNFADGQSEFFNVEPGNKMYEQYQMTEVLDYFTYYYWRVKSQNEYGTSDWSEIWAFQTVNSPEDPPSGCVRDGEEVFVVYPSPAENVIFVNTSGQNSSAECLIYNANGELIKNVTAHTGANCAIEIPIEELQTGAYLLNIKIGNSNYNTKFIKK